MWLTFVVRCFSLIVFRRQKQSKDVSCFDREIYVYICSIKYLCKASLSKNIPLAFGNKAIQYVLFLLSGSIHLAKVIESQWHLSTGYTCDLQFYCAADHHKLNHLKNLHGPLGFCASMIISVPSAQDTKSLISVTVWSSQYLHTQVLLTWNCEINMF